LTANNIAEYSQDVIKFKDRSDKVASLKEVEEIVHDINGMRKTMQKNLWNRSI